MSEFKTVETDFNLGGYLIETFEELVAHLHDDLDDLQVMCKGGVFSSRLEKIGQPDYASKIRLLDTTDANQLYLEICLVLGIPPQICTHFDAADQVSANAHYNLGLKYEKGEGVSVTPPPRNYSKQIAQAQSFHRRAAIVCSVIAENRVYAPFNDQYVQINARVEGSAFRGDADPFWPGACSGTGGHSEHSPTSVAQGAFSRREHCLG